MRTPHPVGSEPEGLQLWQAGVLNDAGDILAGEDVRQALDFWRLHDINPGQVALEHMAVEEAQVIEIKFDGAS